MLNKYCITCHNQKAKIPAGAPLALDIANLKDPGADAAVWEKVVRKLGVGAMPPQRFADARCGGIEQIPFHADHEPRQRCGTQRTIRVTTSFIVSIAPNMPTPCAICWA